jgi:hypothetical protein
VLGDQHRLEKTQSERLPERLEARVEVSKPGRHQGWSSVEPLSLLLTYFATTYVHVDFPV